MNNIVIRGIIRNIKYSHTIKDVEYGQAEVVTVDGNYEDIVPIKFKTASNIYKDGDEVVLLGNIRSYSKQENNNKNAVSLYVFTYFDVPSTADYLAEVNQFEIDGRICKTDKLRETSNGKQNLHFVLANNIYISDNQKLNNYCPSVVWGKLAKENTELKVNDTIKCKGRFHSRTYKKEVGNGEIEYRVANELLVTELEKIDNLK